MITFSYIESTTTSLGVYDHNMAYIYDSNDSGCIQWTITWYNQGIVLNQPAYELEQCSKPRLVVLYRGLYYPCSYIGIIIIQYKDPH